MNMMNIGGNNVTTKEISSWLSEVRFDENLNIVYCFAGAVKVENWRPSVIIIIEADVAQSVGARHSQLEGR